MSRPAIQLTCLVFCMTAAAPRLAAESLKEATSYVELGDDFAKHGELKLAIGAFSVAIQFAPDYAPAYFKRGLAYQTRGDFSQAISDYSKTLEIVPGCADAYANRGYAFASQEDL